MLNKKYLPSKKFLMALSTAILLIIIAIILSYWKPNITQYKNSNLAINATSSFKTLDSDNDNLPDWKENLYSTNPKMADTDKDGTSDFDEIAQNRDPLKTNTAPKNQEPNDKIDSIIIEKNQKMIEEYENLNATEKMARNLMSNFIASQPINGQIDKETINFLAQKSIQDIPQKEYIGITKESDLNLIAIDEKTFNRDLSVYTKSYYIETESFRKIVGQDLKIINIYISSGKNTETEMEKITSKYQTIINNLIKTPIPALSGSSGAIYHLALINDLEKLIKLDNDIIKLSKKDMASVYSDLSVYNITTKELMVILSTLDNILKIKR
ncbi:MAG: hypothetical protein V1910_01470 [bacterium]